MSLELFLSDDYIFVMCNGIHSKSVCKCIMVSRAYKHMTLCNVAFDTYEVIGPHNVHLGDNIVVKVIRMGSIFFKTIVKDKIHFIRIKDVLHMPKLHANLLSLNKFGLHELKVQFNLNKCIIKFCDYATQMQFL